MSALSRGSRTKIKQMNGKAGGAALESMPTGEQDVAATSSTPPSLKPTTAAPSPHILPSSLEAASTAIPPSFDESGQSSNDTNAETVQIGPEPPPESDRDDRSSSLSDIEDRPIAGGPSRSQLRSSPPPEEDDTEAETERLEESPHKLRKHQNVVFSATNNSSGETVATGSYISNGTAEVFALEAVTVKQVPDGGNDGPEDEAMDQISDISSLEDSAEENSRSVSPTSVSGRKRKRLSHGTLVESDSFKVNSLKRAAVGLVSSIANDSVRLELPELTPVMKEETMEDRVDREDELSAEGGDEPNSLLAPIIYTRKKTNRSGKRSGGIHGLGASGSRGVSPGMEDVDANDTNDAEESAAEDVEMEDVIPGMEAEAAMRNEEEVLKKKAALDSLSAIEMQFATLRDKLYEERLTHLNEELAMLNQPRPTHVDYLAMVECIDQRRDEKITQARIRLQYKLEGLQRRSIAERAIAHSQYMQTVQDTRDKILEQANKEWYQIQRERRSYDEEEQQLYLYQFSAHRPHQIARQTAYNKEVSILSGIAKYRGFPAAPEITGAKPSEIEEDLKKMGTPPQFTAIRMATSLSNLSRQRPAAEEQFLEQNPWANPHHPAHHQNINTVHRQLSLHSRPLSPFATPAAQRRTVDANALIGSASAIVALPSAQNSSMAPTPSSSDHNLGYALSHEMVPQRENVQETPSHRNGHVEQGHLPSGSVTNTTQDNGISQPSDLLTGAAPKPGDVQILSSPPSKSHVFASAFAGASSREPISSPSHNPDQREESLAENNVFKSFHSHLPRQLSVGAGVEHGNS
ncbi:hypothetical protein MMC30_003360 [Trapelia coarctata]|nr:hypothetical protein [Trapelia coarctata]